mgnify:CR=1 FL=1
MSAAQRAGRTVLDGFRHGRVETGAIARLAGAPLHGPGTAELAAPGDAQERPLQRRRPDSFYPVSGELPSRAPPSPTSRRPIWPGPEKPSRDVRPDLPRRLSEWSIGLSRPIRPPGLRRPGRSRRNWPPRWSCRLETTPPLRAPGAAPGLGETPDRRSEYADGDLPPPPRW